MEKFAAPVSPLGTSKLPFSLTFGGCEAEWRLPFRCSSFLCLLLLCGVRTVSALNPHQPISSFIETTYTVEDGLPSNVVNHIYQTRDGFLWIATDSGLTRFNGRKFHEIFLKGIPVSSQGAIEAIVESEDRNLWIGTRSGLARISKSQREHIDSASPTIFHFGKGLEDEITALEMGPNGAIWVGTEAGLFSLVNGRRSVVIPQMRIDTVRQAANGSLLIVSRHHFFEWAEGRIVRSPELPEQLGVRAGGFYSVIRDRQGAIWYCSDAGIAKEQGGVVQRVFHDLRPGSGWDQHLVQDRQGSMWFSHNFRLFRLGSLGEASRYLAHEIRALASGQDGEIWIGTNGAGLVRLKDRVAKVYTTADGLGGNVVMSVLLRRNGEVWAGSNCGGLSVLVGNRFRTYAEKDGLANSCVWSLGEDSSGSLWIGTWGGLFRFDKGVFKKYPVATDDPGANVRQILSARDNTLWVATEAGVGHLEGDRFRDYTTADGLPGNRALAVFQDRYGRIWTGTDRGIAVFDKGRFLPVSSIREILLPHFLGFGEEPDGQLLATLLPRGLARLNQGAFQPIDWDFSPLSFVRFRNDLWFSSTNGILRLSLNDLALQEHQNDETRNYGVIQRADGMLSTQCSIGTPNIVLSGAGRLWVATVKGLVTLLPAELQPSKAKCPLFIEQITVGKTRQAVGRRLDLPPGNHRLEIKFDSIELIAPEKIRFQYRLEGVDAEWLNADSTRTAVYTEIPIGLHQFHLRASNRTGIFDPVGISFPVRQEPFFFETAMFRLLCLATALALAFIGYRLRVLQVSAQIQARLQGGLSERERIARDLHDTLLQSVQGLILRVQAASDQLPVGNPTRTHLEVALDRADQVLRQARERLRNLRESAGMPDELAQSFAKAASWAQQDPRSHAKFKVLIEGTPLGLHKLVREEVESIGREALFNAYRHSGAEHIEVEITYRRDAIHLRFRDDGCGMDPDMALQGKPLHWGIVGMRERAQNIGGRLVVRSTPSLGTEVELSVPSAIAYRMTVRRSQVITQLFTHVGALSQVRSLLRLGKNSR